MTNQARLWPEGEVFTRKVLIPTNYDPLPVEVVYVVPPFEVVVALWQNKEHEKTYPLFRQFIQDWSLEEKLTDNVLKAFLAAYSGTADAIFYGWSEYMKEILAANHKCYSIISQVVN
ncbi:MULTISPECIES: hypothetical protein [Klebsiella pneumoniae complex]|uniref:hypothetical protein n=1 Tax=Klebsiella pneumoniae complex TaxID=3390273 RepID=UPI001C84B49F|nr:MULTISPECIES: hypothetical protein [Klebsiella]MDX6869821.1 hypothetical protein [Klebsiella pneumoniae]HBU9776237.1 hypothetical protein [Klebsiella pneumoniae]